MTQDIEATTISPGLSSKYLYFSYYILTMIYDERIIVQDLCIDA